MSAVDVAAEVFTVLEPGVYDGIPDDVYHGDPVPGGSLSSSGARKLLPPSCPALFRWEREHGQPEKRAFDFGHAAHKAALGVGPEVVVVDADSWRTKAAQEQQKTAYAAGKVPLLVGEAERVDGMAEALLAHPIAAELLAPDSGRPEQSLFCQDPATGVWLRARVDWLRYPVDGRLILVDYKSTVCADPAALARSVANIGYHAQAAFYVDVVRTLGLATDVPFAFIAQEKTAPYLITVFEVDAQALQIGRARNRQAIEIFRDCTEVDLWPGYTGEVELLSLPPWIVNAHKEFL